MPTVEPRFSALHLSIATMALSAVVASLTAQNPPPTRPGEPINPVRLQDPGDREPISSPADGPPSGGGFFPGGFGGPMGQERKILAQFDADHDGQLNAQERKAAREFIKAEQAKNPRRGPRPGGGPGGGFGPPPGMGPVGEDEPVKPGPHVTPAEVRTYPDAPFYDPTVLRTIFIDFDSDDWETELADFHGTDVDVPATLTADGVRYPNVGVHFRGASSYMMVGPGHKRSLNVSMDAIDTKQTLRGEKTLNLLNSHEDPSFLSTILYSHIANQHLPAPRSNFVKVVINGEYWGVYVNVEQFNKEFVARNFGSSGGARWKVKGSPGGDAGLNYVGDDVEQYERRYQMKTKDDENDWVALMELCRVLTETPIEELENALKPMLDIDSALWFLALDDALVNMDGYWIRASDYSLYRDPKGVFHIVPHDMNEAFIGTLQGPGFGGPGGFRGRRGMGGPGGPGGPPQNGNAPPPPDANGPPREPNAASQGSPPSNGDGPNRNGPPRDQRPSGGGQINARSRSGYELDPFVGKDDLRKPLRSRLLAVPSLRQKYLDHLKEIAEHDLNWKVLGPFVAQQRALIEADVQADTRKLTSFAAFERVTSDSVEPPPTPQNADAPAPGPGSPPRPDSNSVRTFADRRSAFLLNYHEPPTANDSHAAAPKSPERAP